MKVISIKTIWQGKVGIREKYLQLADKEDLLIKRKDNSEEMLIPKEEIKTRVVARSEMPFVDRFSQEKHYLVYFNWRPTPSHQAKLLI